MTDATRMVLASRPQGKPVPDNFRKEEVTLPALTDGTFLVRVIWLSLDPYMRGRMDDAKSYAKPVAIGDTMEGGAVGEVMNSRNADYPKGAIVAGAFGWTTHAVSDGTSVRIVDPAVAPISTAQGVLGMPGITAWVGLNDIGRAQDGETIVVSAATGAVGAIVGQLARARNMRVIGVAGGADKCAHAVQDLGYHACLDHHAHDAKSLSQAIADAAPDGVDVYFESVGGKTLEAVLPHMNTHGRIALCGMIAWYSGHGIGDAQPLPTVWRHILTRRLLVEGFISFDHFHKFDAFLAEVGPMVRDGRITYREDIAEGLENAPDAFLRMLSGGNFGKQLVRVGADPA
ncbi:hypothetical protein SAMN04488003_12219 [Loktanella fryxellensis]|uniref:Enoyl reductase (ER) domain-containing protein n=1 Tax=Loktanella fryxellensis TaxID=245187 RepID=A0A1H8HT24_9RHOB|nr:NADP-dependent oxidoreductase [Loktanella fryxellensis]SEN59076.1 hypothetical protein SAMN04488003_12219 [Loktanella fryxellensis]